MPLPPGTSASCTPPSSLYWIQKSASSISSAAGNRSRAASPGVRPPAAYALLTSNPPAAAPAPTANPFSKKDRRLNEINGRVDFSSEFKGLFLIALNRRFFKVVIIIPFLGSSLRRFAGSSEVGDLGNGFVPEREERKSRILNFDLRF